MFRAIGKQFRQPHGFLGKIIAKVMKKGNNNAYNIMLKSLDIKDGEHIFEIGYGHGLSIKKILSQYDCLISGIDFSELMYKHTSKQNQEHINNNKVKLHFGDFLEHELEQSQFDKVLCLNVIYFWNDLQRPFAKIKHGLKNNGLFFIYMDHPDFLNKIKFAQNDLFNKYTIDYVVDELKVAGFSKVDFKLEGNGYYIQSTK